MPDRTLRIAHISDLHFDSTMSWPPPKEKVNTAWAHAYRMLQQDFRKQDPHVLAVTGDIANNNLWEVASDGLESSWRTARAFIEDTARDVFGDAMHNRIFIVPGNHDMKVLGNITLEDLREIATNPVFRTGRWMIGKALKVLAAKSGFKSVERDIDALTDPNIRQALAKVTTDPAKFHEIFDPYTKSRYIQDLDLYVLCVDSNMPADPLMNLAQGAVGPAEGLLLSKTVTDWREKNPSYDRSYKLALLHHHPMPIPLAEMAGLQEADSFHLMRNAGTFMRFCIESGIDFVLHGHKHAQGISVVSVPNIRAAEMPRALAVIGAGSVYVPFSDTCSYNVLSRRTDQSWQVNVRSRPAKSEGIATYADREVVTIVSPEAYRRREWLEQSFGITVGRMDVLAMIDEWGDLRMNYWAKSVQPADGGELPLYPTLYSAESKRAAIEDVSFDDESPADDPPKPNTLKGNVPIDPPATAHVPRDVEFSYTVRGGIAFSREYCKMFKNSKDENFSFGIGKRYDSLNVEMEFPAEFTPLKAWIEVVRLSDPSVINDDRSVEELMRIGKIYPDLAETAYCRGRLRAWARNRRLSFHVDRPLPLRYYRVLWKLPETEFDILPDEESRDRFRSRTRAAVTALKNVIGSRQGVTERAHVMDFLKNFCEEAVALGSSDAAAPPLTVDLSIHTGTTLTVVGAMQREPGGMFVEIQSSLECAVGETLRGRAYFSTVCPLLPPGRDRQCPQPGPPRAGDRDSLSGGRPAPLFERGPVLPPNRSRHHFVARASHPLVR
jgi:predicted MPP superfamily phosphohydrolase